MKSEITPGIRKPNPIEAQPIDTLITNGLPESRRILDHYRLLAQDPRAMVFPPGGLESEKDLFRARRDFASRRDYPEAQELVVICDEILKLLDEHGREMERHYRTD